MCKYAPMKSIKNCRFWNIKACGGHRRHNESIQCDSHTIKHTKHFTLLLSMGYSLGFCFRVCCAFWVVFVWCSGKRMTPFTLTDRFCSNFYVIISGDKDKPHLQIHRNHYQTLNGERERHYEGFFICHCYSNLPNGMAQKKTIHINSTAIRHTVRYIFFKWKCIWFLSIEHGIGHWPRHATTVDTYTLSDWVYINIYFPYTRRFSAEFIKPSPLIRRKENKNLYKRFVFTRISIVSSEMKCCKNKNYRANRNASKKFHVNGQF